MLAPPSSRASRSALLRAATATSLALLALLALGGCDPKPSTGDPDGGTDAGPVIPPTIEVRFEPDSEDFYGWPWPSDARLTPEGTPDMSTFPARLALMEDTLTEIETSVHGFATMPVAYFSLGAPVTEASLPQGTASLEASSTIQMIDLSAEGCGQRFPLEVAFAAERDRFRGENLLQVANAIGTVLTPGRPYGVIVLRSFGQEEDRSTPRPAAFDAALADTTGGTPLSRSLEPLRSCLPSAGVALDEVAVATVFTPQDPVASLASLRDFVVDPANLPTEPIDRWAPSESWTRRRLELTTFTGRMQLPIFQEGESPYDSEGGRLIFDDGDTPVVQRWEQVYFSVAMRNLDPAPEGPRPVLVFMDGTGWRPWTHLYDNWIEDALDQGYVIFSFMPQFHGGRAGFEGNTEISTFNLPNPAAGRTNFVQQAAEIAYFVRVIREQIAGQEGLPALDTDHMVYGGHSQGALAGALLAAVEDQFEAYLFNGLSSYLTMTILYREDILNFNVVVGALYSFSGTLDRFHPLLQVIQLGAEQVDTHNYVRRWRGWEGNPGGNHVLVINGRTDDTTTQRGMDHLTMTADLTPIDPPGWDVDEAGIWSGGEPAGLPLSGNATSFDGAPLTLATFLDPHLGHGTIYRRPFLREYAMSFWNSARSGVPVIRGNVQEGPCDDGLDNDGNGDIDCADERCTFDGACREYECDDEEDNDGDGDVDCDDSDCAGRTACREECDGRNDGSIDCSHPGCLGYPLCPEASCSDGSDEDGNGLTDCADPSCQGDPSCTVMREISCSDGSDNDGDGATDCEDANCALRCATSSCADADIGSQTGIDLFWGDLAGDSASNNYPPGDCTPLGAGGGVEDLALLWTAPADGEYLFSTWGSQPDTIMMLLGPDCDASSQLACNDDGHDNRSAEIRRSFTAGESVVVVISAYSRSTFSIEGGGSIRLHILEAP